MPPVPSRENHIKVESTKGPKNFLLATLDELGSSLHSEILPVALPTAPGTMPSIPLTETCSKGKGTIGTKKFSIASLVVLGSSAQSEILWPTTAAYTRGKGFALIASNENHIEEKKSTKRATAFLARYAFCIGF